MAFISVVVVGQLDEAICRELLRPELRDGSVRVAQTYYAGEAETLARTLLLRGLGPVVLVRNAAEEPSEELAGVLAFHRQALAMVATDYPYLVVALQPSLAACLFEQPGLCRRIWGLGGDDLAVARKDPAAWLAAPDADRAESLLASLPRLDRPEIDALRSSSVVQPLLAAVAELEPAAAAAA